MSCKTLAAVVLAVLVAACGSTRGPRAARWEIHDEENLAVPVCGSCDGVLDRSRETCPDCGLPYVIHAKSIECPECEGSKTCIHCEDCIACDKTGKCGVCEGTGAFEGEACPECEGSKACSECATEEGRACEACGGDHVCRNCGGSGRLVLK